jgi:hypothetical protein
MADRLRDLSEREQRIEIMRRNGEDFRDGDGKWIVEPGRGSSSALVRALWGDDPDEPEPCPTAAPAPLPKGSAE